MSTRRVSVSLLELMKNEPAPPPPPPPHPSQKLPSWVESATPRNAATRTFFSAHTAPTEEFQPPPPPSLEGEEESEQETELPPPSLPPPSPAGPLSSPGQLELPPPSHPPPSPPEEGISVKQSEREQEDVEDNSLRTPNLAENHIKHAAIDLKETVESIGDFVPPPPPFEFEEEEGISMPAPPQMSPPSPPSFVKNEEDADVQTEPKGSGAPVVNADKEGNTDREDLGKGDGEVSSVSKPNGREDEGPNESSSTVKFVETSGTPNAADLKGMKDLERSTSNVAEKAVECEIKTIPVPPTPNQFTKSALTSGIVGIERLPSTDSVHEEVETHPSIPETVLEAKGQPKQQNSVLVAPLGPLDSHKPSSEVSTQHPKNQCVPRYYSERDDGLCEDKAATAFQTATEAKESMQKDDDAALFMQPPNYPPPEFLDRAERTNQSPLDVAVKEILRKRQLRRRQNRVKVVPQRPSRAPNDSKVLNQCKQVWSGYSGNESRSAHTLHRTAPRLEKPERIMVVGEGFTAFDTILRPFEDSVRILMHGDRFLAVEDTLQSTRAIRVSAWMDQGMNRMFWAKDRSFGQRRNVYLRDILQVCVEDSNSFRIMCAKVNGSSALEDDKSTVDVRLSHQEPSVVEQWVTSLLLLCNAACVLQPGLSAIKQKRNNGDVIC